MKKYLFPLLALGLGVLLGLLALLLPNPAPAHSAGFSALRARADIDVIARTPHSVWQQDRLVPLRDYLRQRLSGLGLQVQTRRYPEVTDRAGKRYPLENISASIPGKSGWYVLLVSHYDSVPTRYPERASCGAADDGYGLATMLEIAGILVKSKTPLENGVRFLFTDAEETGMLGAAAEMKENLAAYRDINLVINLEARGIKGPVVMFETGAKNLAVMALYRQAHRAFSYSFATDIYRKMPNNTDLTNFLDQGFTGLNFSVLDDLSYYHTKLDNPSNISLGSLQHYGEQVLPVVQAYTSQARYVGAQAFAATQDTVHFSWLPGCLLMWPVTVDLFFCGLLALACLLWAGWSIARGRARLGSVLRWSLIWLAVALAALGLGLGSSWLIAKITHVRWRLVYLPSFAGERWLLWLLIALVAGLAYGLVARRGQTERGGRAPLFGAMLLHLVLLALMTWRLPGGTFLFSLPLLACLGAVLAADLARQPWIALLGVVFTVSLFVPVLHIFFLALTMGALGLVLLLATFPAMLIASVMVDLPQPKA